MFLLAGCFAYNLHAIYIIEVSNEKNKETNSLVHKMSPTVTVKSCDGR